MAGSKNQVSAKSKGRSRLSNGVALPRSVDLRTQWARRFRDLLALHINDLGGPEEASEGEKAIIRRAVTLITELERMEEGFALNRAGLLERMDDESTLTRAEIAALETYQRCANTLRRLLESVGLQRRPKPVPDLQTYLRQRAEQASDGFVESEAAQ